jgi:4-hydroxythreonine-4-phosphate dehydrogenase
MFASLTQHAGFFGEMNVLDNLWMSRVTSHVSLRTALDQITPERIDAALTLADATDARRGLRAPAHRRVRAESPRRRERALRPRGDRLIAPGRVEGAADRGIACKGPFPADTVFLKASAANSTACSRCTTTRARSRPS